MSKINIVNISIRPIIIKTIRLYLAKVLRLKKSNSLTPYIGEFTVFIIVSIPILKAFSNSISEIVKSNVTENKEIIKIIIVKKYLFISFLFVLELLKEILFKYTWFGLVWESKLFKENLISDKTFITLSPELVEKKEPPIITNNKKINERFLGVSSKEIPKFDTLLIIETNIFKKLLS